MNSSMFRRLLAGVALVVASSVHAGVFTGLYVFGDSLSDSGNNSLAGAGPFPQVISGNTYIPSFTYLPAGTYSDGPVWATRFASMLGLPLTPSLAGGTNFAFGGARTGPAVSGFPFSLSTQAGMYLGGLAGPADPTALYVVAGGGNDARDVLNGAIGLAAAAASYAFNIGSIVDGLQAAGAKNIVVWNTPDLGLAPAVRAGGAAAIGAGSFVAATMNGALSARLAGEAGVTTFDLFGLLGDIAGDPLAYGFGNVTDACGALIACDPSSYLFWDGIHPTSGGHELLARAMYAAVPEPGAVWLVIGALGLLIVARRRRQA